jgi:hypothetical protein
MSFVAEARRDGDDADEDEDDTDEGGDREGDREGDRSARSSGFFRSLASVELSDRRGEGKEDEGFRNDADDDDDEGDDEDEDEGRTEGDAAGERVRGETTERRDDMRGGDMDCSFN